MPAEVLRELQERLPGIRLWNFYGQTEMAPLATILGPEEQVSRAGSAGRAALNVETRLVDDDRSVPPGTVGEIVHRSPHATLGYYMDEVMTAAVFRNGWFHSGDRGVMTDDGYLSIVDRKKDMIKTGGRTWPAARWKRPSTRCPAWPKSPSSACPTRGGSKRSWPWSSPSQAPRSPRKP
jgi:fatty-acyl-CoA synthase